MANGKDKRAKEEMILILDFKFKILDFRKVNN